MGSSSGSQTVEQKAEPWEQSVRYLSGGDGKTGILPQAERLYDRSKKTLFNQDELSAMESMRGRMDRDYSFTDSAENTLASTARGDFLGGQNFMDTYGEGILNDVNAQFSKAGRTGSSYNAQSAAKGLAQGAAPLYAQERMLQQQAAMGAPAFQAGQYGLLDSDINALLQAGLMRRNRPYENLQNYANIALPVSGQGGMTQSQQPSYTNPAAATLGGAASGAAVGSQIGWMGGPWGAGIGAGLGYLSSR